VRNRVKKGAEKMKEKTLSRAEVNRRLATLSVDPWKNLSGKIDGCSVNAWATGSRRRISRVSICALPNFGGNAGKALRLAKKISSLTGLVVHWHGGMTSGHFDNAGKLLRFPFPTAPKGTLP
jgi:hypothetical protein